MERKVQSSKNTLEVHPNFAQNKILKHLGMNQKPIKIFVGGFFPDVKSIEVKKYFKQFGKINEVKVVGEKANKPRGFGFVTFESILNINKFIKMKHILNGREIDVDIASRKKRQAFIPNHEENKIYVGEIPQYMRKTSLSKYFKQFGEISQIFLGKRKHKEFAFAFIEFKNKNSLKLVLNKKFHEIQKGVILSCSKAEPKLDIQKKTSKEAKIIHFFNSINELADLRVSSSSNIKKKYKATNSKNSKKQLFLQNLITVYKDLNVSKENCANTKLIVKSIKGRINNFNKDFSKNIDNLRFNQNKKFKKAQYFKLNFFLK